MVCMCCVTEVYERREYFITWVTGYKGVELRERIWWTGAEENLDEVWD